MISIFYGAKLLGIASDWSLTNTDMQNILFLCEYFYAGRHNAKLFDEDFHVINNKALCIKLYQELSMYNNTAVEECMFQNIKAPDEVLQSQELCFLLKFFNELTRYQDREWCRPANVSRGTFKRAREANVPYDTFKRARNGDGRMTLDLLRMAYEEACCSTSSQA